MTTLCNTCTKADVSCPVYPRLTTKCIEYRSIGDATIGAMLPQLRSELVRSIEKHPQKEWENLTHRDMYFAVVGEMNEFLLAEANEDMNGEHGMKAEIRHAAVTAIRAMMELDRRGKQC